MSEKTAMAVRGRAAPRSEGDRMRLARMFAAHHETVWRSLRRRGLSPDAAADATQQTFLVAAERLDDIHLDSERAFLLGTARRVAHTLSRKTVRWQLDDDMDDRAANGGVDRADVQLCDRALSKLLPELAEVFVLYEIEGLSSPELAALLEIPLGSVASRLRRAREQFRAAVEQVERGARIRGMR